MAATDSFQDLLFFGLRAALKLSEASSARRERVNEIISEFLCDAMSVNRGQRPAGLDDTSVATLQDFAVGSAQGIFIRDDDMQLFLARADNGGWEVADVFFKAPTIH